MCELPSAESELLPMIRKAKERGYTDDAVIDMVRRCLARAEAIKRAEAEEIARKEALSSITSEQWVAIKGEATRLAALAK